MRVSLKHLKTLIITLLVISFTSHHCISQDTIKKDTILPLQLSNIPEQSIEVAEFVTIVNEKIKDPAFDNYLTEADNVTTSSQNLINQYQNISISETNLRELRIMLNDYHAALKQMQETNDLLESKINDLESNLTRLNEEELKWQSAYENFNDNGSNFSSLREMVNNVLTEIKSTKKRLVQRLNEALIIEKQLISVFQQTQSIISQIERKIIERKKEVFKLDSPPIWQVTPFTFRQLKYSFALNINKYFTSVVNILKNDLRGTFYFIVFFALLLTGLYYVKGYVHQVHEELKPQSTHNEKVQKLRYYNIFNRPTSITTVICLIVIINNELLPVEIHELSVIVLILPILMLLKKHLSARVARNFILIFIIFLFQKVSEITFYAYSFHRITNLISAVVLLVVFMNVKNNIIKTWAAEKRTNIKKTMMVLTNIIIIMFLISSVSNIFGNVFLSESILNATITSIYAGIVYYIVFLIITQLFELFSISGTGQKSVILKRSQEKVIYYFSKFTGAIFALIWIGSVIDFFRLNEFYEKLKNDIFEFSIQLGDITIVPADLVVLIIIILISFQLSKLVRFILEDEILSRVTLPRGVPGTISMLTRYTILFVGFIVAILAAGIELDKMTIVLGGLGVGIGFGLQNIFNNFVSGLILAFERPIKSGDVIQMTDLFGEVKEIGIRASTVRTFDGAEVIVPNGNLISNELINWTLSDKHRRIEVRVGVAYGTNPETVLDILRKVADDHPSIMKEPAPNALFLGFGDSSLDFRMLAWTSNIDEWLKVQSEMNVSINNSIKAAGIEIPFPQRDLHIRSVSENVKFDLSPRKDT